MRKNRNILLLVLLPLLVSCEDFFRSYVTVPPPPYEKRLVVNLYIDDTDTVLWASVSRNAGSLETVKWEELVVNDARVLLLDSRGDVVCELDTLGGGGDTLYPGMPSVNYGAVLPQPFAGNGETFTLQVTQQEFGMATARQTMPARPQIGVPRLKENAGKDMQGDEYNRVSFTLHDPPGEENYYLIHLYMTDGEQGYLSGIPLSSSDPLYAEDYGYALLLEDKTFDGEDFPARVDFYSWNMPYMEDGTDSLPAMLLEVKAITRDFYLYARSLRKAEEMGDMGFFVEPVQVYNNIEGGLGIFSLSAVTREAVEKE